MNLYNHDLSLNKIAELYEKETISDKKIIIQKTKNSINCAPIHRHVNKLNITHKKFFNEIAKDIKIENTQEYFYYLYCFSNFISEEELIDTINALLKSYVGYNRMFKLKLAIDFIDTYFSDIKNNFNSYRMLLALTQNNRTIIQQG